MAHGYSLFFPLMVAAIVALVESFLVELLFILMLNFLPFSREFEQTMYVGDCDTSL